MQNQKESKGAPAAKQSDAVGSRLPGAPLLVETMEELEKVPAETLQDTSISKTKVESSLGGGGHATKLEVDGEGENDDDESEGDDLSEEDPVGFEGWARVFFQARGDRSAQQILPTNSSTLARESHLYVVVNPDATELRVYPDEDDQRLTIDPPVELKYFYATSVPGSLAGAALFLKEDDRDLRRYIFRFEFRNDAVLQPPSRVHQLGLSAKVAKYAQRTSNMKRMGLKTKAAFVNQEDIEEMKRSEEEKSQEAHVAYLGTLGDMTSDATAAAESFIGIVNSGNEQEDGTWKRRPGRSWGAGYEDPKSVGGNGDDSDFSSDFESLDDDTHDDDEKPHADKAGETIEQSFEKMFKGVTERKTVKHSASGSSHADSAQRSSKQAS